MPCEQKQRFSTLRAAAEWAAEQLRDYGRVRRPYRCEDCHGIHLTKQDVSAKQVQELARVFGLEL